MRRDATLDQGSPTLLSFGARLGGARSPLSPPDPAKLKQHSWDPNCLGFCDVANQETSMAILSANTNPKPQEERRAAEHAKAILGTLTPSSARADRNIFVLRYAANRAKTSTLARLESRYALDAVRTDAATALNEGCRLMDRGHLSQDAIDQATNAVVAWLEVLPY
jgi:hypothetical protein